MMPPGLGFCAVSEKALARSETVTTPRSHWDWRLRLDNSYVYKRFDGTPPEQHIYAFDAALDLIAHEGGIDAAVARHARMARAVQAAVEGWGKEGPWEINAVEGHRSNAVTCVLTGDVDADELRTVARDRFRVSLGAGMLEMKGGAFRIGHLGDLNEPMILGALGGIELAMEVTGLPHGSGLPAAIESLAASA